MESLREVLAEAQRRLREGERVALATVVRTRGSTPRGPGARMLIDPRGGSLGTVGGGCGEAEVLSRAQRVLGTGRPERAEIRLLEDEGWESESVCGGILDVWIECLEREATAALLDQARAAGTGAVSVLALDDAAVGVREICRPPLPETWPREACELLAGGTSRIETADGEIWVESLAAAPELVIVGAGHVGAVTARMASEVGFSVHVLDDRESFANPARLPQVARISVGDPALAIAALPPHAERSFVFVSRGHRLDAASLAASFAHPAVYRGMIGSRRRVRRICEHLAEQGAPADALAALHAPIGLDIGAETPAEIAVAIVAELVRARRRRPG